MVGCSAAVDARDNTSTTGTGVPIYWLNGNKVADDYADFYDGDWYDEANGKNESGTDVPDTFDIANFAVTGCNDNGTESFDGGISQALGATGVPGITVGQLNSSTAGHGPLYAGSGVSVGSTDSQPMYGLSAVLQVSNTAPTVVNEIPNQYAVAGTTFSYAFPSDTFNDVDGEALTYTATKADGNDLPMWLGFNASTRKFSGTPSTADVGTLAVKVTASDTSESIIDEFDIVVRSAAVMHCNPSNPIELWCANLTVGTWTDTYSNTYLGYLESSGSLSGTQFSYKSSRLHNR